MYPPVNFGDKMIGNSAFLLHFAFRFMSLSNVKIPEIIDICFVLYKLLRTSNYVEGTLVRQ